MSNVITNNARKIKNNIRAISTEIIATPPKPRIPAIIASIRNAITAPSMDPPFFNPCITCTVTLTHETKKNLD